MAPVGKADRDVEEDPMASTDRLEQYYSLRRIYGSGVHRHWYERARAHRSLYDWMSECLMSPRWRRQALSVVIAAVVIAVGALASQAREDFNGYRLAVGQTGLPNELTLSRQPALGRFNPPLWRHDVATGFLASQLQSGSALARSEPQDWFSLESMLDRDARWMLRQANRLHAPAASTDAATPLATDWLQTLSGSGLARFAAADPNFLPFIRQTLSSDLGGEQKRAAIQMVGYSARSMDADAARLIIDDLVQVIKRHDVDLIDEAATAMVQIAQSVDASLASAMVPVFRQNLSDADPLVALPAAMALGRLSRWVGSREATGVADDLRNTLVGRYTGLRVAALAALAEVLPHADLGVIRACFGDVHGMLGSGAVSIRKAAAELVGGLAEVQGDLPWDSAASDLLDRLRDDDAGVRAAAAWALGNIAGRLAEDDARVMGTALQLALRDADRTAQSAAAQALGKVATSSGAAAVSRDLRAALLESDTQVKRTAVQTLGSVMAALDAEGVSRAVSDLRAQLDGTESEVRREVIYALGKVAPSLSTEQAREIVSDFLAAIADADDHIRRAAEFSLAYLSKTLGSAGSQAIADQLLNGLGNENTDVQIASASALGRIAKFLDAADLEAAVKGLSRMRAGVDANCKRVAMLTLGRVAPYLEPSAIIGLTGEMLDELRKGDSDTSGAAVYALGNMVAAVDGDSARVVAHALRQSLATGDLQTRMAAAYVLGTMATLVDGTMSRAIASDLRTALDSQDAGIRRAAAESLGKIATSPARADIRPIVGDLMRARLDGDAGVNDASGHALGSVVANLSGGDAQAVVADLLQALSVGTDDGRSDSALAETLGVMASRMNNPAIAGAALMHLDAIAQNDGAESGVERFRELRRSLASASWTQSNETLLGWLAGDDSKLRLFAAHVLAQRQPFGDSVRARILALRNDPQGRPWVKVAALRCLVEMARERQVRETDNWRKPSRLAPGTVVASS